MSKKQKGFSLIELLIVVAIILIIAAIAIPNLLRSRMAANEASAVGSLRTINTAAVSYNSTYNVGFPPSLGAMGGPAGTTTATCGAALQLDSILSNNGTGDVSQKSGYSFVYAVAGTPYTGPLGGCAAGDEAGYTVNANPLNPGTTGQRYFCTDGSGVIRFDPNATITAAAGLCASTALPLQ